MNPEVPATASAPIRVCSKCSVQSQVLGDFCPNCGRSFTRGPKASRKAVIAALVALVLLVGIGTGVTLKVRHDRAQERAAAADERRAAQDAAELEAEQQEEAEAAAASLREQRQQEKRDREAAERRLRGSAIKEMQKTITTDARDSVTDGLLDGPILYTFCNPLGGGSIDDLTALTTTFDCLAVNEELEDGRASGYGFDATMNWNDGSYTWQFQS
jgi:predicted  nucleic acid-binding Zn-ribbon protein